MAVIFASPLPHPLRQRDFLHRQVFHIGMPDVKIVGRHGVLERAFGRFREANRPALGHDQEGQDHGDGSYNGCRSHGRLHSLGLRCLQLRKE